MPPFFFAALPDWTEREILASEEKAIFSKMKVITAVCASRMYAYNVYLPISLSLSVFCLSLSLSLFSVSLSLCPYLSLSLSVYVCALGL